MNKEGELKLEFEEFIEDLVKDIVKSVLYEDFKALYDDYTEVNKNLLDTDRKIKQSNLVFNKTIENLKSSSQNIDKSSEFLNKNIELLTKKIEADVRKRLEESVLQNKKNMDDLSEEMRFIRSELLKFTKENEQKINKKMVDTENYLQTMNDNFNITTSNYQNEIQYKLDELNSSNKKMGILAILLGAANVFLIAYMIISSMGAM